MSDVREISGSLAEVVRAAAAAVVRVEARRRGPASGILWDDGVVVTAEHVVEEEDGAEVGLPDGRVERVREVRRDEGTDVAVLLVEKGAGSPPALADEATLAVGQLVLAVGRPGRTARASLGVLSAVGDAWRTPAGSRI